MTLTRHSGDVRLSAEQLTYALPDGRTLFHDLTLGFGRERTGLIGANGTGKTTLIRLLTGELTPSSGAIHRAGAVAVLPQDFRPHPDDPLSIVLGIHDRLALLRRVEAGNATLTEIDSVADDWDLPERAAQVLARFGLAHFSLDRPVGAVSGGEATRVALAGLSLGQPDFLLLDEPTNHLDAANRAALYDFVEEWRGGVLCVSHDRELLRRVDRIIELSSLGVRVYGGNWDDYRAQREAEDEAAARELDSAAADLRRAQRKASEVRDRQAKRAADGRRAASSANMPKILLGMRKRQAQATTAKVRAVTDREVEERRERAAAARRRVEERERPRFGLASSQLPHGRTVLEMTDVTVQYAQSTRSVLDRVSLRIEGPERVAVVGPNGSGKSTLLHIAIGHRDPDSGDVRRLSSGDVAYLDQFGAALDPSLSVLANFRAWHPVMDETAVRYALARFLFSHEAALQAVGTLSGGQRLRASLACVLGGEKTPSLLVLDEPTNHLDLDALEALEAALRGYDGALLVASHDAEFLDAIGIEREVRLSCRSAAPRSG